MISSLALSLTVLSNEFRQPSELEIIECQFVDDVEKLLQI